MDKIRKTVYNEKPAINFLGNSAYSKKMLCRSIWFSPYMNLDWKIGNNLNVNIGGVSVDLVCESVLESYMVADSEHFRDMVFNWLLANNFEDHKYWEKEAQPILAKLESKSVSLISEGLLEFKHWVYACNNEYIERLLGNVDLSVFGYEADTFVEGDLWPNPLFDDILTSYKKDLNEADLKHLIEALFISNETYQDCKATHTAIMYLLEKRTDAVESFIVDTAIRAFKRYEHGHRYFERSLIDRLVDDIFPTFSVKAILKLLENLHPDMVCGESYRGYGDNFIVLADDALTKDVTDEERERLLALKEKCKNQI